MHARTLFAALAVAVLAVLGLSLPATADSYPPAGVHVVAGVVSDTTVAEGDPVTFSGGGFAAGALVRISVDGVQTTTVTADGAGAFSVTLTLKGLGAHVLAASGLEAGGRVRVVSATVNVVAAQSGSGGGLPFTGSETYLALLGGLGLVAVGTGVSLLARSRRQVAARS